MRLGDLDLSTGATFIDSVTIGVLVRKRRAADLAGRILSVTGLADHTREVMATAGVLDYLTSGRPMTH